MRPVQPCLFADPQPLVERLGRDFFRQLPEAPGVYLMRDGSDAVLYVGKAKNLRKRLGSYRVANPDRMRGRLLRLLHRVQRIDCEKCSDETAALARESELLLSLRPRFNRAGVWPPPRQYLAWRTTADASFAKLLNAELCDIATKHDASAQGDDGAPRPVPELRIVPRI